MTGNSLITPRSLFYFVAGILVSSLMLSPFVLDFTLNTRFIFLSVTVLLTCCGLWTNRQLRFPVSLPVIILCVYLLVTICSAGWATNENEAWSDAIKITLAGCFLIITTFLYHHFNEVLTSYLSKVAVVISLCLFAVFIFQLIRAGDLHKESMYSITGLNGHKNLFSSFLFLIVAFLAFSRAYVQTSWKLLWYIAVIVNLLVITILRTKAVFIGIACSFVIFFMLYLVRNLKFKRASLVAAGILLLVFVNIFFIKVLPWAIDRTLAGISEPGNPTTLLAVIDEERLQLWKKSYHIVERSPWFGVGAGNWQVHFPDATLSGIWRAEDLNFTFQRPHNDLLWILCETGYVGLNVWIVFLLTLILMLISAAQSQENKKIKFELILLASAIFGFTVISFFDFPRERIEHQVWFMIILAYACTHSIPLHLRQIKAAPVLSVLIIGSVLSLSTAVARYSGEFYTRKMYQHKNESNYVKIIETASLAKNPVYTLDPTSVPLSWYSGNAYASMGNYARAFSELNNAYRLNPFNRNVLNDHASALIFNRDTAAAISFYKEASRISPRYDEPKLNLAAIYIAQKKYIKADSCLATIMHDSERRSKYQALVNGLRGTISN
jgi:O-antigen ligase